MLKVYDPWEDMFASINEKQKNKNYICYASELTERLNCSDADLRLAIVRAFKACASLDVSINKNFSAVYCSSEREIIIDWLLSPLACYLIIINADPKSQIVARIQIHLASKNYNDVNIF